MENTIIELSPYMLALVPITVGLVQVVKGLIPTQVIPVGTLLIAVGLAFLVPDGTWQNTVISGLTVGLMALGLYSGSKTTLMGGK